jgi:UPF0716 protein FxsA
MFFRLLILLTVVPIVELAILIRIGKAISLGPTLGIILLTGVVGAALAKREGLKTLARIQAELSAGTIPAGPMVDGLLILIAAALLVTPGVLTDVVGFLLLVPPARHRLRDALRRYLAKRVTVIHPDMSESFEQRQAHKEDFIDVEAEEVCEPSDGDELPR